MRSKSSSNKLFLTKLDIPSIALCGNNWKKYSILEQNDCSLLIKNIKNIYSGTFKK